MLTLSGNISFLTSDMLSTARAIMIRAYMKDSTKAREYHSHYADDVIELKKDLDEFLDTAKDPQVRELAQSKLLDRIDFIRQQNDTFSEMVIRGDVENAEKFFTSQLRPLAIDLGDSATSLVQRENQVVSN